MPDTPQTHVQPPTLPLQTLLSAIANPLRWRILAELAGGEQLMVAELAERTRQSANIISKHMIILREAGIATAGRNRLYQLRPQFIADKTNRILDFGWCLLRMNIS